MNSKAKKSLGQHFLTDRNILGSLADAAGVGPDTTVIEVGPGRGSLTRVLAERAAHVVAVEIDDALVAPLREAMPGNVEVVHADARKADPVVLLGGCGAYVLAGSLPYYAALPILRRFLESRCRPNRVAALVQREVADQLCAAQGDMSLASLGVQVHGSPRITRIVRPGSFSPAPKVTSAIVAIDVRDEPVVGIDDLVGFFTVARAGFSSRRKQLRNALASGLDIPQTDATALLVGARINPTRRAETLGILEWAALYQAWLNA